MKKIQMLAIVGLTFAFSAVAFSQSYTKPAAITVVSIKGEARYSVDGKTWHPLVVGKILRAGAVLETATGSTADLVLSGTPVPVPENTAASQDLPMVTIAPDPNVRGYMSYKPLAQQNVIRMTSGTMLAVDQLTVIDTGADTVGNTEVDLRSGKIFFSVKKISASSQYIIKLPNGVAGIRGSTGYASADGSFGMLTGQAVDSTIGKDGQPHVFVIDGGSAFDPGSGQVVPLSSQIVQLLTAFNNAAQTLYHQLNNLLGGYDLTCIFISPTEGYFGHGHPVEGFPPQSSNPTGQFPQTK
ncbi:MAG TPA: FecR domain-containing protein [Candidatus Saccharimonadales bacterium]|nr:FecR domain-containing protein [Candidatus Saccharimonadales bacterium]